MPDDVRGELYLHSMPGRYEDLAHVWNDVSSLGVTALVCLTPLDEIQEKSPTYAAAIEEGTVPVPIRHLPIRDYQGPDDDQAFQRMTVEVADRLRRGETILVHCGSGIGRTGMFAIGILMALGLSAEEARQAVGAAGSGPERQVQEKALRRLATRLRG